MPLVTKRIPKKPLLEQCILYLYRLGYGKDSISLILKGSCKSGQIERFLRESGHTRTIKEAMALRMSNNILPNTGYDEIKVRIKLLFPGII